MDVLRRCGVSLPFNLSTICVCAFCNGAPAHQDDDEQLMRAMRKLGYKLGKIFVSNLDVQGGHKRVVGNEKSKLSHELGNLFWFLEARFRWKLGNLDKCSEIFCCIHTA